MTTLTPEQVREIEERAKRGYESDASGRFEYDSPQMEADITSLLADRKALVEALTSIANNTCCDKCQEAALVARSALQEDR